MLDTAATVAEIEAATSTLDPLAIAEIDAAADALDTLADALSPPVTRFTPTRQVTWDAYQADRGAVVVMSVVGDEGCIAFSRDDATGIWRLENADYGTPLGVAGTLMSLVSAVMSEVNAQAGA